MRIVAFITEPTTVRAILDHLGEPIRPPIIAPARGPPLWDVPMPQATASTPRPSPHQRTHSINALPGNDDPITLVRGAARA